MQPKYPGLYLYYDWLDGLSKMEPEKAMKVINNLRHYSESGREPEPIGGAEDMIQSFMLSQLRRSKRSSESNKQAAQKKKEQSSDTAQEPYPAPNAASAPRPIAEPNQHPLAELHPHSLTEPKKRVFTEQNPRPRLISEQIPPEELDREATEEELRIIRGSGERSSTNPAVEDAKRLIESIRKTYGSRLNL